MRPFGRSRVRELILVQLFNHPGAAVHVRELARRIGASPAAVSKELASLQQAGIVSSRRIGRSLQYQMGEGPVAEAARTLFQRTVGVEALLREALTGLPGVEAAFIHGSYASGNQRSDGDVHVIVVGEPDRVEVAERLANAERQIGRPVSLLWDGAAFQLMAAGLQLAGYRVASSVGHHRTAIDATRVISGERGLMMRLDSLRRARDQTMYDGTPPEEDQVREALSDVEELAEWVRVAVARARGLDG